MENIPRHVGIIMDGNGRWASHNGVSRGEGHARGVEKSLEIIHHSLDLGIEALSLYAFSTENWQRPESEISKIFKLLELYLKTGIMPFLKRGVRFCAIGSRERFSLPIRALIDNAEKISAKNSAMTVNLALDYGGKSEIVRACKRALKSMKEPGEMTEELLEKNLDTGDLPPVDLIIRTSGEKRISNFMIWQAAYAEFYFSDVLWPDFSRDEYLKAIENYGARTRRFGAREDEQD